MLPIVTGSKLCTKNECHESVDNWSAVRPERATTCGTDFIKIPLGMKYIFAILCSYPDATNVAIGNKIAKILPITLFELVAIQTAKQTNQLHKMPRHSASVNDRLTLP